MKEICKNCIHCKPTYKSYYCDKSTRKKKVKLQETCMEWTGKQR